MITKGWRVYGREDREGQHRMATSFSPSFSLKTWTGNMIDVLNSDRTGSNFYTIIMITAESSDECERELEAQLSDGIFENSKYGKIEEVKCSIIFL